MIDIYIWIGTHEQVLRNYSEPADCVDNDDGTTFKDHILNDEQFLCAHQMAVVLQPVQQLLATLEGGLYPTSNLVKPYVGKMIDRLEPGRTTTTVYRGKKETIKVILLFNLYMFVFPYPYALNHYILCIR